MEKQIKFLGDEEKAALAAASVLHIFEKEFPDDDRPRKAIEAVLARLELQKAAYAAAAAARAAVDAAE